MLDYGTGDNVNIFYNLVIAEPGTFNGSEVVAMIDAAGIPDSMAVDMLDAWADHDPDSSRVSFEGARYWISEPGIESLESDPMEDPMHAPPVVAVYRAG